MPERLGFVLSCRRIESPQTLGYVDVSTFTVQEHRTQVRLAMPLFCGFSIPTTCLGRILRPGGHIAFEVGEVRGGKIKLEEAVLPCGTAVGLEPLLILINDQKFTKTANCWGVDNNSKGTNTNRVVVFRKP